MASCLTLGLHQTIVQLLKTQKDSHLNVFFVAGSLGFQENWKPLQWTPDIAILLPPCTSHCRSLTLPPPPRVRSSFGPTDAAVRSQSSSGIGGLPTDSEEVATARLLIRLNPEVYRFPAESTDRVPPRVKNRNEQ